MRGRTVPEPRRPERSFLEELKTRRVYRVAALYVVVAFALLQGADLVLPAFDAPEWVFRALVLAAVGGLFVAVALAWAFDLTPQGLERTGSGRVLTGPGAQFMSRSLVGIVALAAVGAAGVTVWRGTQGPPPAQSGRVMVFPLVVSDASSLSPEVGEDVATMIGHALDGLGPLRWIDGWPLLDAEARDDVRRLTLEDARRLAAERECGYFLTGRVVLRADSALVLLELRSTETGEDVAKGEAAGAAADPWRVGLRAVTAIVEHLIPTRVPNVEARFSERPPGAVAQFLLGEQSYRRASFTTAFEHFEAAFDEDPTFALAAIRGAQSASWEHDVGAATRLIDAALLLDLSPRDRLFTEGIRAYLDGDAESAIAALEGALAQDSLMGVAWAQLGEVHRHLAPLAWPADDAAQLAFEQAYALDSNAAYVLYHLLEGVIRAGDVARATGLLQRFRTLQPDPDLVAQVTYMHGCVSTGAGAIEPVQVGGWARERPLDLLVAAAQLSAQGRQLPCAEAMYLAVLTGDTATDAAWRGRYWSAFVGLGGALLARGAVEEGERLLSTAVESYPAFRALVARARPTAAGITLPADDGSRAELAGLTTDVDISPLEPALPVLLLAGAAHDPIAPAALAAARRWRDSDPASIAGETNTAQLWLFGLLSARDGRFEDAATVRARLVELAGERTSGSTRLLIDALDAHLALLRGDTADALRRLEQLKPTASRASLAWGLLSPLPLERLLLARVLLRRGEPERAQALAAAFDGPGPFIHPMFVPASLEVRRDAAAALGSRALAGRIDARLRSLVRSADGPI